jgi:basic membrane protein A and related proteins
LRTYRAFAALLAVMAIIIAACGGGATTPSGAAATSAAASVAPTDAATTEPTEAATAEPSEAATTEPAPSESAATADFKACEVSDTGGIDDKGFNQNAYKGLEDAQAERPGIEIEFLESQADADYARNIQTFIDEGCDIIVTVGFLLGTATQEAATANPDQKFGIVDFAYDPPLDNVTGIVFKMDEPSMMAGYLAAGMSQTGTVATFGGINIPPVAEFMKGFEAGVHYYNEQKGADVQLLGWDSSADDGAGNGSFVGNFEDTAAGASLTEGFIQEGADVIFAVAGPVGLGAMTAVQDANEGVTDPAEMVKFIGVDVDQSVAVPEHANIMLSSVLKRIDNGVKTVVLSAMDDTFEGGVQVNTLENEGTGLAEYHEFEEEVPAELTAEIEALEAAIIDGSVVPADWYAGAPAE